MAAPESGGSSSNWFYDAYCTYTTLQVVKVKSFTLASVHHGVQALIVAYSALSSILNSAPPQCHSFAN